MNLTKYHKTAIFDIFRPAEDRRLSWPGWSELTHQGQHRTVTFCTVSRRHTHTDHPGGVGAGDVCVCREWTEDLSLWVQACLSRVSRWWHCMRN